jgi:DNA-binding GntR family transcriptional regulator
MERQEEVISLADEAYHIIKKRIIEATYPPNSFLTEASLSEDLQMSRMPVRTAVKRLQNEGWLFGGFRKKIKVRGITRKDVEEIYQLRKLVEESAMKLIFETGKTWEYSYRIEEKVVRMRAVQFDPYEWEYADTEMHIEIVSVFDNSRIDRIYRNNQEELVRIGMVSKKPPVHVQKINDNLYVMTEAIREKDFDKAMEILRKDHIESGLEMILAVIS